MYLINLLKKLFLGFCLCLGAAEAQAQFRIDQWTADDGLPQNSVYGIVQTADGYLWLATVDGLARFDGVQFSVFNKSNSPGIVNNRFISLAEDPSRNLWAGTEESGIVRYSGGRFETFGPDDAIPRGVYWIESDPDGDGPIFTGRNDWIRFRDGRFSPLDGLSKFPPEPAASSTNVKIACRISGENEYSECFVNGQWLSFPVADGSSPQKFVSVGRGLSAARGADGTVWMITADGRIAHAENGRVTRIFDESDGLPKYPLGLIHGTRLGLFAKDTDGTLWLVDLPSLQKQLLSRKDLGSFSRDRSELLSAYADGEGGRDF